MTACKYGDAQCPCQDGDACHYEDCGDTPAWPSNWVSMHAIRKLRADIAEAARLLTDAEWDDWSELHAEWCCGRCMGAKSGGHREGCPVGRWLAAHAVPDDARAVAS